MTQKIMMQEVTCNLNFFKVKLLFKKDVTPITLC